MMPLLLQRLPFLLLYSVGVALTLRRKNMSRELALWGAVCYGVLIALSIVGLVEVAAVISASKHGLGTGDWRSYLKVWGYFRMAVFYLTFAALAVGALRGRENTGDLARWPRRLVGVSVAVLLVNTVFAHRLVGPTPWVPLIYVLSLGSTITLMVAFFGWRPNAGASAPVGLPALSTPAVPQPSGEAAAKGMFEERDYFPFLLGVLVLAGLVAIPVLWGHFTGIGYARAIIPSLVSCGIFIYAHDKRGNFSVVKLLVGYLFLFMTLVRAMAKVGPNGGKPFFVAGGFLGFVVMFACGWAGIAVGRLLRRTSG
ncbi:MAG: hypothetical protein IPH91_09850 [Elusimicrobia bacterium]|nr:hypothetical protein [Elusimicrobiota bacterium]